MKIPLILQLKRQNHKELAIAQDIMIENIFNIEDAVFHGGTAIWRCYGGNRFSEDIDLYLPNDKKVNEIFNSFEKNGLVPLKKKVTKKGVYSKFKYNRVIVRFEAVFKNIDSILVDYNLVNGNSITIYSLSPESLIVEKTNAYLNRLKIRDLYDVFFLLKLVKEKNKLNFFLNKLIKNYKQPVDENNLKTLIINGIIPSSKKMMEYVKKWV